MDRIVRAEELGFRYGWTYDSHILWQEGYILLTLAAAATSRIKLGHCVTNPGIREPTVTASAYATLQDISGGRMVMGIGHGDSSRRVVGLDPVPVAQFEAALEMIKALMNGREVRWNDRELQLAWAQGQPEIPMYVAGYGPRALGVAGRVGDGVVIQLADPEITRWIIERARAAAVEAGRDADALAPIVCAPAIVDADLPRWREETRWFPAMVSNHVKDLIARYGTDGGLRTRVRRCKQPDRRRSQAASRRSLPRRESGRSARTHPRLSGPRSLLGCWGLLSCGGWRRP